MLPHAVLLTLATWIAWRPAETVAVTPVLVSLVVLAFVPWAHRRTSSDGLKAALAVGFLVLVAGTASAAGGWDRAQAATELSLAVAGAALVWIASRERCPELCFRLFALGVSALALWALWQVTVGFEVARAAVDTLPAALQTNAEQRLSGGRAFASLLLPGHLAALLATALPLLVAGIGRGARSLPWLGGALMCLLGLVMTRSPIGIALAALAVLALLLAKRRSRLLAVGFIVLTLILVAVVLWRPDVGELDPVRLRVDNWRSAWWAWSTSPIAGVGLGSFGQVIRAVPFEVGNLPAHAHSLPMEWFAELGIVGLVALGLLAVWLVKVLRSLWSEHPELAVSLAVVPLHNLVDFSLYTSGVALPWAVLLGWSLATTSDQERESAAAWRPLLVALASLGVAASLLHMTSRSLETAAVATPSAEQRFSDAMRASRVAPWRPDPVTIAAGAALESGRPDLLREAGDLVDRRRWLRPGSATLAEAAGRLQLSLHRVPSGAAELCAAARLQPASVERGVLWQTLLDRLEAENARAQR